MKKVLAISLLCLSVFLTAPSNSFSQQRGPGEHHGGYSGGGYYGGHGGRHGGYPGGGYYGGHGGRYGGYPDGGYYGGHGNRYGNHHNYYNDDLFWGATGFLFGTAFGAALYQPPVYNYNPPVYYQPPMCRYERYVTDQWGRTYVDSYVAPCR